ncbi:MAG TPA: hypothetical protein DIW47_13435 [Bacteroidetes bacterium]|nr:hypothetical protein [Bacteroidota bacterium]
MVGISRFVAIKSESKDNMNRYSMIKLFLLAILLLPTLLSAQNDPLNEDWLQKDKANFLNIMELVLSENSSIDDYKKKIENLNIRNNQDIGFGAKRHDWVQYGGYISTWITLCSYKDTVFYCKLFVTSNDIEKLEILAQRDSSILMLLSRFWNKRNFNPAGELNASLEFEYTNKEVYFRFKESVKNELGELENISVDSGLAEDYQILLFPSENYDFGYACYYAGNPPYGRIAIENIKETNPYLIKNILRGYNPEGRIYALEALLQLAQEEQLKLTSEDIETIKKVLTLDIPIGRCEGCMVSSILAKDLFSEKGYSSLLKKYDIVLE